MEAKELRIGNSVLFKNDICNISSIQNKGIYRYELEGGRLVNCGFVNPIPLTEELLRKLDEDLWDFVGFGCRIIYQHSVFINLKLEYAQGQVYVYFKDEMIGAKDYVHQLQNLFFALTNQEIKLKI